MTAPPKGDARQRAAQLVDDLLLRSSARAEWLVALVRILMISGLMMRFVWLNSGSDASTNGRFSVEGPVLGVAFVLASWIAWRVRAGVSSLLLYGSVLLDAAIANGTLLAGVLYPWPDYVGLLRIPDIAIVPALCLAAGLRLSVRVALLGSAATALLFAGLLWLDLRINAAIVAYGEGEATLYSFYFVAASALSVGMAYRAYALAVAAANETERATRAQSGLAAVLQDNHDLGSLLSSARINADLLSRVIGDGKLAVQAVEQLSGDLRELSSMVSGTRENAYIELTSSERIVSVDVRRCIDAAITLAGRRMPALQLRWEPPREPTRARVAGGERGLERLLLNVLINAGEGDGQHHASEVAIMLQQHDAMLELVVADNGPGFPAQVMEPMSGRVASSKLSGSGLGLMLVHRIASASGGSVTLTNARDGGMVRIALPSDPSLS